MSRADQTVALLHPPPGSRLRPTAPVAELKLAVARALIAQVEDRKQWSELALITDTGHVVLGGRLLDAMHFGDGDYEECVHGVVPDLLGLREEPDNAFGDPPMHVFVDNLPQLEGYLELPDWLSRQDPRLHRLLYAYDLAEAATLNTVTTAATDLGLAEIVRQLERLHRDLGDDVPAAVGHTKDLVESACRAVLGPSAASVGKNGPSLISAALRATDRHAGQVDDTGPDAQLLKRLLGPTTSHLEAVFTLRNRAGTGHGRAGDVQLDEALARLTIGMALNAVSYLLHISEPAAEPSRQSGQQAGQQAGTEDEETAGEDDPPF